MRHNRILKASLNIIISIVVLLLIVFLAPFLLGFFIPFVVGYLIAALANPLVKLLEQKLKIKRKIVTFIIVVFVIAALGSLLYGLTVLLISQLSGFLDSLPSLLNTVDAQLQQNIKDIEKSIFELPFALPFDLSNLYVGLNTFVSDFISSISMPTLGAVGSFATNLPSAIISIITGALSAYFFISEREYVVAIKSKLLSGPVKSHMILVLSNLKTALLGYVKAQLKIEIVMYFILLIGLLILGVPYAALIAFGMAIIDILPFLGTAIVLVPWAIVQFLMGNYIMAIGLLAIWAIGQFIRQLIQPKFVSDSIGLAPLPTLFLLFIGYKISGVLGMIIAVPIGIIIVKMNEGGVFDTFKNSVKILIKEINSIRELNHDDIEYLNKKADK